MATGSRSGPTAAGGERRLAGGYLNEGWTEDVEVGWVKPLGMTVHTRKCPSKSAKKMERGVEFR